METKSGIRSWATSTRRAFRRSDQSSDTVSKITNPQESLSGRRENATKRLSALDEPAALTPKNFNDKGNHRSDFLSTDENL
jgi:hypothetical protein